MSDVVNDEVGPHEPEGRWLTPGVASVSVASFGSDAGHELVTSLLPGGAAACARIDP